MSLFKDLLNKLFVDEGNGEDEEVVFGELEDLVMEDPDLELKKQRKLEKQQRKLEKQTKHIEAKQKAIQEKIEQEAVEEEIHLDTVKEESLVVEEVQPEVVEVKDSFTNIEIEKKEVFIKKPVRSVPIQTIRKNDSEEYVYTPVISPYYGQSEKELKQVKEVKKSAAASLTKKEKELDPFGTIISPFFGKATIVEPKKEVKEEPKEQPKAVEPVKPVAMIIESEPEVNFVQNDDLEEQSLTLEQIIGKETKGDVEQISLFGDSELFVEPTPIEEGE